jgi:hypothetical protein
MQVLFHSTPGTYLLVQVLKKALTNTQSTSTYSSIPHKNDSGAPGTEDSFVLDSCQCPTIVQNPFSTKMYLQEDQFTVPWIHEAQTLAKPLKPTTHSDAAQNTVHR